MSVEVSCPGCGSRLKAPENSAGKKVKCKKCTASFRIPGPTSPGGPAGESQALSVVGVPALPLPGDEDEAVPMAAAVEDEPAGDVASLPSADPFDFSAPPATKPAAAPPARPAFGSAPKSPPAPPKPTAPKPAAPAPTKSGAKSTPLPPEPPPPAGEPLSLDDDDPPPPPKKPAAAAGDPFDFFAPKVEPRRNRRDRGEDEAESRSRRNRPDRNGEDEGDEADRRYVRPGEQKPGKTLLYAGILGVLALGAAVAAVIVFVAQNKEPAATTKATEKKEEPPATPPPDPPKTDPKADPKVDPKGGTKVDPKADPKLNPKVDPKADPKVEPPKVGPKVDSFPRAAGGVAMMTLPAGLRSLAFRTPPGKPEVVQMPARSFTTDNSFDAARRVFPPAGRNADAVVVWQSSPGFEGKGERLTADVYSGTGARVGRVEFDGDGANPVCDVSPDGKFLAAAGPDGKITVWNLADGSKSAEGFDPYPDPPGQPKTKPVVAAVFFTRTPGELVVVSGAGAVHLHDVAGRKVLGSFVAPNGVPGRVVLGKGVTADEGHTSVALSAGGVVYQIGTGPGLPVLWKRDFGEVGRSFGVAVAGNPGRLAYAFETDAKGKRDRAILFAPPGEDKQVIYRWPDKAGEPAGVLWAGGKHCVIPTTRGAAVWAEWDDEVKRFAPLALAEVAGGKALHATGDGAHWYLMPGPNNPAKSVLVELAMPPEEALTFREAADGKEPLYTVRLDEKGMSK